MLGAAHKPGAMPLRPLGLGDIYDAAFRVLRFNPRATVGSSVVVASVAMTIPILVTVLVTFTVGVTYDAGGGDVSKDDAVGFVASYGALGLGLLLQTLGLILVTGMVAQVTAAAAVGRRLSLGDAWAATRGKRWRLVGLTALLALMTTLLVGAYIVLWAVVVVTTSTAATVIWGVLSVPAFVAGLWFFWIRLYYLPVPVLMLEEVGVLGALGRGYRLSSRQFWRIFGIALLTVVVTGVAGNILAFPVTAIGNGAALLVDDRYALLATIVGGALAQIVSAAFVAPFTASVTTLQYLDQRMRKEAYDVELMSQAGVLR